MNIARSSAPRDSNLARPPLQARAAAGAPRHLAFSALSELLQPGDLLVLNDTRVIRSRLFGNKPTGGSVELLLERQGARLVCLFGPEHGFHGSAQDLIGVADTACKYWIPELGAFLVGQLAADLAGGEFGGGDGGAEPCLAFRDGRRDDRQDKHVMMLSLPRHLECGLIRAAKHRHNGSGGQHGIKAHALQTADELFGVLIQAFDAPGFV